MSDHQDSDGTDADPSVDPGRAESFAKLVDGMLEGESIPPALDADVRALLESATMIVASTQEVRLSGQRSRAIVEQALEQAITGGRRLSTVPETRAGDSVPIEIERENTDVIRMPGRGTDRFLRALPWVVAGVAAAAALLLFLSRPANLGSGAREELARRPAPLYQSSRPADSLVGQIAANQAGEASKRLDVIYADRMAGYRELQFSRHSSRAKSGAKNPLSPEKEKTP